MKKKISLLLVNTWKPAILILLLSLLIFLPDAVYFLRNGVYNYLLVGMVVVPLLLLVPTGLFFFNLRIYYTILAILSMATPIALLPVLLINSQPNSEMLGLVLDTNYHEVTELLGWRIWIIALVMLAFLLIFLALSKKLPAKINIKKGLAISGFALMVFLLLPFTRTTILGYYKQILKNTYKAYYPFRIGDAFSYLQREMKNEENYHRDVADFSFGAYLKNPDSANHIHILMIGETARYDHWGINGYERETSPYLSAEQNLITFSNVASGGTMTNISVPLIICRTDAENFDLHKKEKSILAAYKEVGFKSYWISNQSRYGLTGNIGMHYNDGDTAIFNGYGSNETNFAGNTDSALVPMVRDILQREKGNNVFLVVHTIGSHWRYLLRYPESFTKFKPVSDRNRLVSGYPPREVMINEYDNSILYTDYIIAQIINLLKETDAVASLSYVSDHGENLGDDERKLYFHSYKPTKATAHVPLFIWTSEELNKKYPEKVQRLRENKDRAISSAGNLFHTMLDISGIGFRMEDSTRSIASPAFKDNEQKIVGENRAVLSFREIR